MGPLMQDICEQWYKAMQGVHIRRTTCAGDRRGCIGIRVF